MKNILVPTDFSDASANAAAYAAALAEDFQAKLILLNVVAPRVVIEDISATAYLITEAELSENNKRLISPKQPGYVFQQFDSIENALLD